MSLNSIFGNSACEITRIICDDKLSLTKLGKYLKNRLSCNIVIRNSLNSLNSEEFRRITVRLLLRLLKRNNVTGIKTNASRLGRFCFVDKIRHRFLTHLSLKVLIFIEMKKNRGISSNSDVLVDRF